MDAWMALAAAAGGVLLGLGSGRLPGRAWMLGYALPLIVIVAFAVSVRRPEWTMHPAWSWVWLGKWRLVLCAGVVSMVFSSLMPRLPKAPDRRALGALVAVAVLYFSLWPALSRARSRPFLQTLSTRLPPDGVCRQSTDYTCGPAAAVTGLARLGLKAGEGELALAAGTSAATGTPPDVLAQVLNERFAASGLRAELRRFRTLEELREAGLTLVVVRFGFLVDHWLTVLEVTDRDVVAGDPASGVVRLSHEEFQGRWRRIGVTLSR